MPHFTPSPLFQIRLEENTLTMRGSQAESVGCVLRGQLVLALTEPTKFKEIKLTFQGKSKVSWADGSYYHNEERILYQHDWTFLPATKQHHVLKPNNYHWDFELVLPGTLPETIEGCQNGSIKYMLKAVAERPPLAIFNLHTNRPVTLLRSLSPNALEILQTSVMASTWTDKVIYEFATDSKVFGLGDKVPIMINLRSLRDFLKVQKISCELKEYTTYTVGTCQKKDSKMLGGVQEDRFSRDVNSWNNTVEITIPNDSTHCRYDSENEIIRVEHKLKFNVTFIDQSNQNYLCELRATLPIIITSVSPSSDDMALPAYYENNQSFLDKANSEDNSSSTSTPSSTPSLSSFSESWHEIEGLSQLPSYRSIASRIPTPLADSLLPPTYDASISGH